VSIGISDISGLAHQILQVLPADPSAEVLNTETVVGPLRRTVFVQPWGAVTVAVIASPSSAETAVAVTAAIASCATGVFNQNPFSEKILSI
jgi:hypothetical protein